MMKNLNIMLEDNEFIELTNKKGQRTWKEFLMLLLNWEDEPILKGDEC